MYSLAASGGLCDQLVNVARAAVLAEHDLKHVEKTLREQRIDKFLNPVCEMRAE